MRFIQFAITFLIFVVSSLANSLYLTVPATNVLPSPSSLLPSTHATLTKANLTLTALLRRNNVFKFFDMPDGSYLCDIYNRDFSFAPLRVDVDRQGVVEVYQTFRGNEWDNKGERLGVGKDVNVNVKVLVEKNFYESRGGCKDFHAKRLSRELRLTLIDSSFTVGPLEESYDSDRSSGNGHDDWNAIYTGQ